MTVSVKSQSMGLYQLGTMSGFPAGKRNLFEVVVLKAKFYFAVNGPVSGDKNDLNFTECRVALGTQPDHSLRQMQNTRGAINNFATVMLGDTAG